MSEVLVIQNEKNEGAARLGELLKNDGFKLESVLAKKEKIPNKKYSLLVIMGGPQSANDDLLYLSEEKKLIRTFVENEIPVLGICLGSQLIAKTFGAKVYAAPKKEIGFYHDLFKDNSSSKLFSGFENPFTVFHWHGETFDLPTGAIRLARSDDYANQAIQYKTAVGVQFHLEVDEKTVRLWLENSKDELSKVSYIKTEKILNEIEKNMPLVNKGLSMFYKNFKSEFNL